MKKTLSKVVVLCMAICSILFVFIACDKDKASFYYDLLTDGTYSVSVRQSKFLKEIIIPSSYNGIAVTQLGDFSDCGALETVVIPDSVTSIGDRAFCNCRCLKSITIPNNVTSIGYNAFTNCVSLESIIIPDSVTYIGNSAFYNCASLQSVTIPGNVTDMGTFVFYNCGLKSVTIGSGLTYIASAAFNRCYELTSIIIPNSVTSIGSSAFDVCIRLSSVYYTGTLMDWFSISASYKNSELFSATCYYYCETEPVESGNYWHYDTDCITPVVWNKSN